VRPQVSLVAQVHAVAHHLAYLRNHEISRKASMMSRIITSLPVEIIVLLTRNLAAEDQLNLKMTCARFASATPSVCFEASRDFRRYVMAHLSLEIQTASHKQLHYLICTVCGKVKARNNEAGFPDAQSSVEVLHRHCITCSRGSCFIGGVEVSR